MLLVSNNLLKYGLDFPSAVVRLNLAWCSSIGEAKKSIEEIDGSVFLDYPQGRTKPPKPVITLAEAIYLANTYPNVEYFAVSNVEDPYELEKLGKELNKDIQLVPKIETKLGVDNIPNIIAVNNLSYLMLDKEDLYVSVNRDSNEFNRLVEDARVYCRNLGATLLELQGVIFL